MIGDVVVGADSSIWPGSVIRGDVMPIRIGQRTSVQDGTVLHGSADSRFAPGGVPLNIGDDVTITHGVVLHACTVESSSLVWMNATVLDRAVVSSHTIIGANSLVPVGQHLESGFLWMGSPVEKIRALKTEEIELIEYLAAHYVELKNAYR